MSADLSHIKDKLMADIRQVVASSRPNYVPIRIGIFRDEWYDIFGEELPVDVDSAISQWMKEKDCI